MELILTYDEVLKIVVAHLKRNNQLPFKSKEGYEAFFYDKACKMKIVPVLGEEEIYVELDFEEPINNIIPFPKKRKK